MATKFYGSISLSELVEKAKSKHSAFSRAENGKIYVNIDVWINDEPDKFGNAMSVQLRSKKELRESEGKTYIGNCKLSEDLKPRERDVENITRAIDDLPF